MPDAIGFDVYGTLVDPLAMERHLHALVGEQAGRFAALWREKQLEYSFRRGLMRAYASFDVCTAQALTYVMQSLDFALTEEQQADLLAHYRQLAAFPDVIPAIDALRAAGHTVVAFSNGVEATVRALLDHAGVLPHLDGIISVDDLGTFKPNPDVYTYLAQRLNRPLRETWLVSSNPFDIIGAKAVGLKAIWVRRNPAAIFDPWGVESDMIVADFAELAARF